MIIKAVKKTFNTTDNKQYEDIGKFWDEMIEIYGMENLIGIGYNWTNSTIDYVIGLKFCDINFYNCLIELPDQGWSIVRGKTKDLNNIYDEIYLEGTLLYEIELFFDDGSCEIRFIRNG